MFRLGKLAGSILRGQGVVRQPTMQSGCVTAAALVAAADPQVSLARRITVDQIFDELDAQVDFHLTQALMDFENSLEGFRSGGVSARQAATARLRTLAQDEAMADVVFRIARAVALADGPPSREATAALAEIATCLGRTLSQPEKNTPQSDKVPSQVIVIGNEKGGTGKSTTAIHIAMGLAQRGIKTACLDLDGRQATLSRFLDNRTAATGKRQTPLVVPRYQRVEATDTAETNQQTGGSAQRFFDALRELADHDAVIVDTPGYSSRLASMAYSVATTVVTPLNDSFIDIDALADIDVGRREVRAPSSFTRLILQQKDNRNLEGRGPVDWIVARNRIGQLDNRNSQEMTALLSVLSQRLGFRLQPGFSERLVFRALFYRGLTLFDLDEAELPRSNRSSLLRARQEVGDLLDAVVTAADRSTRAQRM